MGSNGKTVSVEVALQYNESFDERVFAFANTIHNVDGGPTSPASAPPSPASWNDYARKMMGPSRRATPP